jgi:uncharacterized protein YndB with AHSA1/START domain/DNA/RNA-binding domain of Phe-tRNA-synthetase-like protein
MSDGTIEQADGRVTFRFERRLRHPIDVVWKAITDPAEIEAWFGGRVEIELKPGGHYISHHRGGVRVVDRIVRLEPPTVLEHTFWEHVNPSALVTWELCPIDEGCVLVLTHSIAMDDVRAAAATVALGDDETIILSRNAAGWHHLLDMLEAALDGRSLEWSDWPEFSESWRATYPGAAIGVLAMSSVRNAVPGTDLSAMLASVERKVRDRYAGRSRSDLEKLPALQPYVEHYRRFGKTYHVLLQLESVAFRGRPIAGSEPLVSAMFAAEIANLLLTAGHDLDAVRLPLVADVTRAGDRYVGIAGEELEVKPGDMCIRDGEGILSSVLYGPDHRTRLRPETVSVLFTTYAPRQISDSELERHLREMEALVLAASPLATTELIGIRRA